MTKLIKVQNMISFKTNNSVPNQFLITEFDKFGNLIKETFQSYRSIIVTRNCTNGQIILDEKYWNYSHTTSKYRNEFMKEDTKETKTKIKSGEYKLENLNN